MARFSLACTAPGPLPEDFAFLVGSAQYRCSQVAASVRCRTVRLLLLSDPTAAFIVYPDPDPKFQFGLFVQALGGKRIRIDESNHEFLWRVSTYFQCDELRAPIAAFAQGLLTPRKCLARLRGQRSPTQCAPEIEFLARHFGEVQWEPEFQELPLPILDAVLGDSALAVDERELFEFVSALARRRRRDAPEFSSLFAHVLFEEVDPDGMRQFLEDVPSDSIGGALWAALTKRLEQPIVVDD
jgi:hypothetical protein